MNSVGDSSLASLVIRMGMPSLMGKASLADLETSSFLLFDNSSGPPVAGQTNRDSRCLSVAGLEMRFAMAKSYTLLRQK